ncbi:MAG: PepSY domain-containing protein [Candidatus Sericytochromatia bacterium]|nr:PepSY domain-containing protein [Candidatus Sericytochromatia bacterium]
MNRYRVVHRTIGFFAGPAVIVAAATALGINHIDRVRDLLGRPPAPEAPFREPIVASAVEPGDPRHILVGTLKGLYGTRDGGRRWERLPMPISEPWVGSIAFDPTHPRVVYVALHQAGLWRSEDAGTHWALVELPFRNRDSAVAVDNVAVGPTGALTVVSGRGMWRQARPGGLWSHFPPPTDDPKQQDPAAPWLRLLYDLHEGHYWNEWGRTIVDAVSVGLVGLVLSGYGLMFGLGKRRRRTRRARHGWPTGQASDGFWGP